MATLTPIPSPAASDVSEEEQVVSHAHGYDRGRHARFVVDSSSESSEASQEDSEHEDERQIDFHEEFISSQRQLPMQPADDDASASSDEDDAPPKTQDFQGSQSIVIPPEVEQMLEPSQARTAMEVEIADVYLDNAWLLCQCTGNKSIFPHVKIGLKHAALRAGLDISIKQDGVVARFVHTLSVHVFQVVCCRAFHAETPQEDQPLSKDFGSYTCTAYEIIREAYQLSVEEFKQALEFCEHRLNSSQETGCWREGNQWLHDIPRLEIVSPSRNPAADENLEALAKGKFHLLRQIIHEDERSQHVTALRSGPDDVKRRYFIQCELTALLAFADTEIMAALIDGSYAFKAEIPDHPIFETLSSYNELEPERPSIYANCIVDRMGLSPTPFQWSVVCKNMLEYVDPRCARGNNLAVDVDQLIGASPAWPVEVSRSGLRRYTEWPYYVQQDGATRLHQVRRTVIKKFALAMQERLAPLLEQKPDGRMDHVPLAAPPLNIGYSKEPTKQLLRHRKHRQSNYLMNLPQAIFEHVYPGAFRLQQNIIFPCFMQSQTWIGEIVFSQIAQAYTDDAGGFSHETAGRSNWQAYAHVGQRRWAQYLHYVEQFDSFFEEIELIGQQGRALLEEAERELREEEEAQENVEKVLESLANGLELLQESIQCMDEEVLCDYAMVPDDEMLDPAEMD